MAAPRAARLAFVMELQAGMRTQYLNWRRVVEQEPQIAATWVPVSYYEEGGWIERLKVLPGSVRGVWRGYLQTSRGLGETRYDAVLFNTHNTAVVHRRAVYAQRAFLMFDVTPRQYDTMADWYEQKADKPGWMAERKYRRVREVFQAAEGLFAWSHWAAESAIADYGADPKRIYILPPGVDTQLWRPLEADAKPNDGVTRLLFTGGNFERKGGDLLLRWARETPREGWELHLVTMDRIADPPPGVVVHNDLGSNAAELVALAQRCDLFVLPTRADCFSIASLEAMAAGLPVITSRVGGIPDIVREGETGYLLAPDDYAGLCDRLDALLDSPELRQEMGRKGREVVCAHFEVSALVQRGLRIMAGAGAECTSAS
jgi:glycosyltransferase involved in cell wall biosynthesis